MRFLYNNLLDSATVTSDGAIPGFALANLQDTRLSRVYRSIGTADNIVIDLGSAVPVDTFTLARHNITTESIILQANAVNDWAAPAYEREVYINSYMAYDRFDEETYRYWRVVINDPANALGQIEIGRIGIGVGFEGPPIATDATIPIRSTTSRGFSRSRQAYYNEGVRYRAGSINFGFITAEEKQIFTDMFAYTDTQPIFIEFSQLPDEQAIYANVSLEFDFAYNFLGRFFTLVLEFEEVF